ncbi:hypothetical protein NIES2101_23170 [Calothrix sp. HK-06]|nr:hypothetical protein NIES2101_23170 [Calothrix sp. HK-06]
MCECFYEIPKTNGVHIAHNIGDKLPYENNEPIYIAVFGNYFGVGICPLNALLALNTNPRKLIRANSQSWFGAAEQPEIKNKLMKFWITINTLLWKH